MLLIGSAVFTIDVLKNQPTKDGKYLPAHVVVTCYSPTSGEITQTDYRMKFVKVGSFYLPQSRDSVTTENGVDTTHVVELKVHLLNPVTRN